MPNGAEDHPTLFESIAFFVIYLLAGIAIFSILGNLSKITWIFIIIVSLIIVFFQNLHKLKK